MRRVAHGLDRLSHALHLVAGVIMVALMLMTVANIVGRTWFQLGVSGAVELTQIAMIGIVYFAFAHAYTQDDHVTVDLLYERLPRLGKTALDVVAALATIPILAILAWQLLEHRAVLEAGGRVTHTLGLPLHPVAWIAVVGTAVFGLAVVVTTATRALDRFAGTEESQPSGPPRSDER